MKSKEFIDVLPLETNNLIIRKVTLSDAKLLVKMDQNENVQKFLGGIKATKISDRERFIQKKLDAFKNNVVGMLTVVVKSTSEPIGFLNFDIDEVCNNAELSYIFDFDYWNQGYCTESAEKLIKVGFENLKLHRIYADTISCNMGSIKVLQNIGMTKEGELREHVFIKELGEYMNFINYGILNCEYENSKGIRCKKTNVNAL